MNAVEIESAVSDLAAGPFDPAEFPFQFLAAFDKKQTTLKRLRKGDSNKSDIPGAVLLLNSIHLATCAAGETRQTLERLKASSKSAAARAKFVFATDGKFFRGRGPHPRLRPRLRLGQLPRDRLQADALHRGGDQPTPRRSNWLKRSGRTSTLGGWRLIRKLLPGKQVLLSTLVLDPRTVSTDKIARFRFCLIGPDERPRRRGYFSVLTNWNELRFGRFSGNPDNRLTGMKVPYGRLPHVSE